MNSDTPTPRTDAAIITVGFHKFVTPKFARTLERKLAEANNRISQLKLDIAEIRRQHNAESHW